MDIVDHETLLGWLTRLQLTAIRDQLDSLLDEAAEKKLTLREALAFLVEREVSRKDERRIEMAFKIAHFPAVRELADFDFKAQPSIDERQVRELATSRWIAHGDAALLLGPPGVGKTHLAIALGREAIRQRYSALFTTAQALMAALVKAHSDDRLEDRLTFYAKPKRICRKRLYRVIQRECGLKTVRNRECQGSRRGDLGWTVGFTRIVSMVTVRQ